MLVLAATIALPALGQDSLQWNGFAMLRGSATTSPSGTRPDDGPNRGTDAAPLGTDVLTAQLQVGLDWRPSLVFGAHVHLLARSDDDDSRRGRVGVVEAYAEQNLVHGQDRLHLIEGAFFLPTSRENVDALWESPYTITPSALNSWLGEEFRPVGVDAAYTRRQVLGGAATAGVTLYEGNDTFGALPAVRGWALRDRWTLLGEHLPVDGTYFTSVSAETDHHLGWAARGRWNNDHATVQFTHIDNRSDAIDHGELLNWATRFDIVGADYTAGDWNVAAESGWGVTTVIFGPDVFPSDIRASYLLLSRRFSGARASVRVDEYEVEASRHHAVTAAFFLSPRGKLRTGVEAIVAGSDRRASLELRYSF
jgi:hypothetical protein